MSDAIESNVTDVAVNEEVTAFTIVRTAMRAAIGAALAYGAFCVFALFAWKWLAILLALFASVFAERVVLKLADKHIDTAAQVAAGAIVSAYGWLSDAMSSKPALVKA